MQAFPIEGFLKRGSIKTSQPTLIGCPIMGLDDWERNVLALRLGGGWRKRLTGTVRPPASVQSQFGWTDSRGATTSLTTTTTTTTAIAVTHSTSHSLVHSLLFSLPLCLSPYCPLPPFTSSLRPLPLPLSPSFDLSSPSPL